MSVAAPEAAKKPTAPDFAGFEARVRGESLFDRVTSMLMAIVVGALLVVGWLGLIYLTNQAYNSRVVAPMEIVDVSGGGGSPDGTPGSSESVDVAGAEATDKASNATEEMASRPHPPAVEQTTGALIDPADVASSSDLTEIDTAPNMAGGPRRRRQAFLEDRHRRPPPSAWAAAAMASAGTSAGVSSIPRGRPPTNMPASSTPSGRARRPRGRQHARIRLEILARHAGEATRPRQDRQEVVVPLAILRPQGERLRVAPEGGRERGRQADLPVLSQRHREHPRPPRNPVPRPQPRRDPGDPVPGRPARGDIWLRGG